MELPTPKILFSVSLSNGETLIENKGKLERIAGQPSPWQKVIRYVTDHKLIITSLSLLTPSGAIYSLPPTGDKAKFVGYRGRKDEDKPIDYEVKRFISRALEGERQNGKLTITGEELTAFYTIAEVLYPKFTLQLWVDEHNYHHSWTVIKHL